MTLAFSVYAAAQVFIVYQGTSDNPHRLAKFFLARLDLNRRSHEVARREHALRRQVVGGAAALAMSPIIGGVIPPMLLWRQDFPQRYVRRLSVLCAMVYAAEFSILHGWLPSTI